MGGGQNFSYGRYGIKIPISYGSRINGAEINGVKPMMKRLVQIIAARIQNGKRKYDFHIIKEEQEHRPLIRTRFRKHVRSKNQGGNVQNGFEQYINHYPNDEIITLPMVN